MISIEFLQKNGKAKIKSKINKKKNKRNHRKYLFSKNSIITFILNSSNFIYEIESFQEYFSLTDNKINLNIYPKKKE